MVYPQEQTEELKKYCTKLGVLTEGGVSFIYLDGLRLPVGCTPTVCDGLLCPVPREGYLSRLYFSQQITSGYTQNWNQTNARIGEKNWFAFSWKIEPTPPTLVELLIAHLAGFTRAK